MASADLIPKDRKDLLVDLLVRLQKTVSGQAEPEDAASKRSSRQAQPTNPNKGDMRDGEGVPPSDDRRASRRTEKPTMDSIGSKEMERGEPSFVSSGLKSSGSRSRPYSSQYPSEAQTPSEPAAPLFPVEPEMPVDEEDPSAIPDQLEQYLEQLYEDDIVLKIEAAKKILFVAQRGEHIAYVANNGTLLGALARTVRDEYRKSVDLTLALMQIWYCLAHYKVFHQHIVSARVGDVCLRAVELEQRRHVARMIDLERFEQLAKIQASGDAKAENEFRHQDAIQRERENAREASAAAALKEKTANFEGKADEIEDQETVPRRMRSKPLPEGKIDIQRERQRTTAHKRKSECLQFVCLSILLFLAEDLEIERKMCKRGVVGLLVPLLQRTDNLRLVQLAVRFLRKLSIFEENKNAMVALGTGPMLSALLPPSQDARVTVATASVNTGLNALVTDLRSSVMHLMFNLTFDQTMATAFLHANAIDKSTALLRVSSFRQIALKLLYRLSTDYPVRGRFATADTVRLVMSLVLKFPNPRLPIELAGLAINLCLHPATAAAILSRPGNVSALVKRLVTTGDSAVAKMIRGLTQYTYGIQADAHLRAQAEEDALRTPSRVLEALGLPVPRSKKKDKDRSRSRQPYDDEEMERKPDPVNRTSSKRSLTRSDSMVALEGHDQDMDDNFGHQWEHQEYSPFLGTYVPDSKRRVRYRYEFIDLWQEHVDSFLRVLVAAEKQDTVEMTVEMLGIFSNLTPLDLAGKGHTWRTLAEDQDFMYILTTRIDPGLNSPMGNSYLNQIHFDMDHAIDPITRHLSALGPEDDVLLEAIQVVSAMVLDPSTAPMLLQADIPRLLAEVTAARSALDYDVTLQAMVALTRCLVHKEVIQQVAHSLVSERVAELLSHPHVAIAAEASDAARLLIEQDREHGTGELAQMLIARRFAVYNREWLQDYNASAGRRYHNQSSTEAQELLQKQVQMQAEAEAIAERARANKLGIAKTSVHQKPVEVSQKPIKWDPNAYPLAYVDEWEVADPLPKVPKAPASVELRSQGIVADEGFDVDDDDEHELSDQYEDEMLQGGLGGISLSRARGGDQSASGRSADDIDSQSGSPLKPMGRYGEAVAFDIGYLYSAAAGAGEKLASGIYDDTESPAERKEMERMLAEAFEGRRDGVEINCEHYDYYEDAMEIPGEAVVSEDEEYDVPGASKNLVNAFMH